jgi:very-short-patch-repair endonuclease
MSAKIILTNVDNLVSRYIIGESIKKLAAEWRVDRNVIKKCLLENGVTVRNQSQSETIKWKRMSAETRSAQVLAAHKAARGSVRTVDQKIAHAISRERSWGNISLVECVVANHLTNLGYSVIQQKAIYIYNVDIAIKSARVVVEIFGGNFHASGSHAAIFQQRTKDILDRGWSVIIVWIDGRRYPLDASGNNRIAAFVEEASRNPTGASKYRMIFGNGQDTPAIKSKLNSRAIVESSGYSD